jgi:3',5'-cyclic AMP phosphodiesterase CpdA
MPLRFVHVSDIHLLDLSGTKPWQYLNKRITGRLNLALKRRKQHDERIFDAAVAFARALKADRLVITGDLTNLSLPSEFVHVRDRLDAAGVPVTVIPGNHDTYTRGAVRASLFERHLGRFMDGEREPDTQYPFVQRFGDVVLIGVSTGIVSLPLFATGAVGPDQLARLEHVLAQAGAEKLARIVLIHHPPVAGVSKPRHDLVDLAAFGEIISRHGAELILHGHEHRRIDSTLPGPSGDVPVHGIGSGTSCSQRPGREASLSLYEADRERIHRELYTWNGTSFARAAA